MNSIVKKENNNLTQRFSNKVRKIWASAFALICTFTATVLPASAGPNVKVNVNKNLTIEKMVGGIISFIINVAFWMGIVVVATGIFMFVFAYKDDNAESQSRAARMVVVGAIMLGLGTILKLTGLVT